jgi:protein-S-isoprenylcysteine O-methyltransferase Ste14
VIALAVVVESIYRFQATPKNDPVTAGLYKVTRNPQFIGLFVANVGASLIVGSWVVFIIVVIMQVSLHLRILSEEKSCIARYGEKYREYMRRVPRYLLFF